MNQTGCITFTKNTTIEVRVKQTSAIKHALRMIERDHETVFGERPKIIGDSSDMQRPASPEESADIVVRCASSASERGMDCPDWPEAYSFRFKNTNSGKMVLHIVGRDELGVVYGLLAYSRRVLGVDPLWYWADLPPAKRDKASISIRDIDSEKPKVRYRGWFVNDEVCLIGWSKEYPPTRDIWLPVFECLLRLGGNMVIPGTDLPKTGVHTDLAHEMGLWVTHHHAEPLGAEMFLRAFPGNRASYREHPALFEALWKEAIEKQKDKRIVWVLSFRGQGDKPFWEDDPAFDTPEKRGAMISQVVRRQYDLIREAVSDPVCSMAMYGEIAELYKAGYIEMPKGVILIWADNGYGKMVSRRHGNQNYRVPALPEPGDGNQHGIYYHVTFHDLQASNHLTMFSASPDLIIRELTGALQAGADEYLIVNSGNIRPHLYTLDLTAHIWSQGEVDRARHMQAFTRRLFTSYHEEITDLYLRYFEAAIPYGPNEDDRAGDEYYHHPARQIICHWMQGLHDRTRESLIWATGDIPFAEQVSTFEGQVSKAIPRWSSLEGDCKRMIQKIAEQVNDGSDETRNSGIHDGDGRAHDESDALRLSDHLLFHIRLHLTGCLGFHSLCRSYTSFRDEQYPIAFVHASRSLWYYKQGLEVLRKAEHGKWHNFYSADWLTNIENTVEHVESLRRYIRMHGDSPDMFSWYKEYLMPETEKYIYLENTHRNPLTNDQLAEQLQSCFIERNQLEE